MSRGVVGRNKGGKTKRTSIVLSFSSLCCPGNVLRLSGDLIRLLSRWAAKPDASEEERGLAKALYDDFSRYDASTSPSPDHPAAAGAKALPAPTLNGSEAVAQAQAAIAANAEKSGGGGGGCGQTDSGGERVVLGMDQDDTCRVVADRTLVSSNASDAASEAARDSGGGGYEQTDTGTASCPRSFYEDSAGDVDRGEEYKKRGNDAFARGEWTAAIAHYGKAIDAPVSYQKLFDEAPRRAVYHANRAAAYLARGASPGGGRGAQDASGHLEDATWTSEDTTETAAELNAKAALMDCDAALDMQPGHVKAKFRLGGVSAFAGGGCDPSGGKRRAVSSRCFTPSRHRYTLRSKGLVQQTSTRIGGVSFHHR